VSDAVGVILSQRVADGPSPVAAATTNCDACAAQVHLSPTSIDMIRRHPLVRIICIQCGDVEVHRSPQPFELTVSDEQLAEVSAHLRRPVTRAEIFERLSRGDGWPDR
jgi:hypothetical protein